MTLLTILTSNSTLAAPGYDYRHIQSRDIVNQQAESGPDTLLRDGMAKLLRFLRQSENPDPNMMTAFLENEIAPYFDFDYMATWAAGPMNRQMNDQQRADLAQEMKKMLLGTLTKRLASYNSQDVRFYRPRRSGRNEVRMRVGILQAGGYPTNIDFRFYQSDAGWKVFDVAANGNSALAYYRQYFMDQIRSQQPNGGYRW